MERGDVVTLERLNELARAWYDNHLDSAWRKWSIDEARGISESLGLTGETWRLPTSEDRF